MTEERLNEIRESQKLPPHTRAIGKNKTVIEELLDEIDSLRSQLAEKEKELQPFRELEEWLKEVGSFHILSLVTNIMMDDGSNNVLIRADFGKGTICIERPTLSQAIAEALKKAKEGK